MNVQGKGALWIVFGATAALALIVKDHLVTPYDDLFERWAAEMSVPGNLLRAIAKRESNFNTKAVGDGGKSFGVMQVHRETADAVGFENQDLTDPVFGIGAGAAYLKRLRDVEIPASRFTLEGWISAYNEGSPSYLKRGIFDEEYVAAVKSNLALYDAARAFS